MKKIVFAGILIIVFGLLYFKFKNTPTVLSPVSKPVSQTPKEIIGFVPYWNLDSINETSLAQTTTIYYFGVSLNPDGSINKKDPGWLWLNSQKFNDLAALVKKHNLRFGLTIVNLDPNIRPSTDSVLKLLRDYGFIDLNLDLEYTGDSNEILKKDFHGLITHITDGVRKEIPGSKVTVDMLADGVTNPRLVDAKTISESVDKIIIMEYDFNRLNAISAGPVAPLPAVLNSINSYLENVPPEKLILGIPFYGYEWPTLDNQKNSFVIKSSRGPELSTYKRSLQTIKDNNIITNFDDESKSPWFSYYDKNSGSWRQVWFENERSLNYKTTLVRQFGLGGTAIFALGYEGPFDLLSKLNF